MYRAASRLLGRALDGLFASLGTTAFGVIVFSVAVPLLIATISAYYVARREGKTALLKNLRAYVTISTVTTGSVWLILFAYNVVAVIYNEHQWHVSSNRLFEAQHNNADGELAKRVASLESGLNDAQAFNDNMLQAAEAFSVYRSAIGRTSPCAFHFSAPKETANLAIRMAQLITSVTNCVPTSVIETEIDPDTAAQARKGMISDKIVFHARRDAMGAIPLYNDLGSAVPLTRSYDVPANSPEHFIWLQFGDQVKWVCQMR